MCRCSSKWLCLSPAIRIVRDWMAPHERFWDDHLQRLQKQLDIHEDDQLDEAQLAAWVKQASQLPGERM